MKRSAVESASLFFLSAMFLGACSPSSTEPAAAATGGQGTGGAMNPGSGSGGASVPPMGGGTGGNSSGGSPAATGGSSTPGSSTGGATVGTGGGSAATGGRTGGASGSTGGAPGSTGGSPAGGGAVVADPGTDGDGDIMVGPTYTDSPDLAVKSVPHGTKFQLTMAAAMSTIFQGTDAVLNTKTSWTRQITVYIPKQYVDGAEAPFMVVQDGSVSGNAAPRLVTIAENLAADPSPTRKIPPLVIIFVPNGGGDGPGSE